MALPGFIGGMAPKLGGAPAPTPPTAPTRNPLPMATRTPSASLMPWYSTLPANQQQMVLKALLHEARGEGDLGMANIAQVIRNRSLGTGRSASSILTQPHQFTGFDPNKQWSQGQMNMALNALNTAPTVGGATHYYNPSTANPNWGSKLQNAAVVGNHRFGGLANEYGYNGAPPSQVASSATPPLPTQNPAMRQVAPPASMPPIAPPAPMPPIAPSPPIQPTTPPPPTQLAQATPPIPTGRAPTPRPDQLGPAVSRPVSPPTPGRARSMPFDVMQSGFSPGQRNLVQNASYLSPANTNQLVSDLTHPPKASTYQPVTSPHMNPMPAEPPTMNPVPDGALDTPAASPLQEIAEQGMEYIPLLAEPQHAQSVLNAKTDNALDNILNAKTKGEVNRALGKGLSAYKTGLRDYSKDEGPRTSMHDRAGRYGSVAAVEPEVKPTVRGGLHDYSKVNLDPSYTTPQEEPKSTLQRGVEYIQDEFLPFATGSPSQAAEVPPPPAQQAQEVGAQEVGIPPGQARSDDWVADANPTGMNQARPGSDMGTNFQPAPAAPAPLPPPPTRNPGPPAPPAPSGGGGGNRPLAKPGQAMWTGAPPNMGGAPIGGLFGRPGQRQARTGATAPGMTGRQRRLQRLQQRGGRLGPIRSLWGSLFPNSPAGQYMRGARGGGAMQTPTRHPYRPGGYPAQPSMQAYTQGPMPTTEPGQLNPAITTAWNQLSTEFSQMFGKDLSISSGYRSPEENKKVGGAQGSRHLHGLAIDIANASSLTPEQRNWLIRRAFELGFRGLGDYKSGALHFDMRPNYASWGSDGYGGNAVTAPWWPGS